MRAALVGSATVIALASAQMLAASPRSVDVRQFDVAGVRTGMDLNEALAALKAHFKATPREVRIDPYPMVNIVTGTKLPGNIVFQRAGTRVTVHFEGRVPVDPVRPLAVVMVTYEIPFTPANAESAASAALAKYGVQSNAPVRLPMTWCAQPNNNPGMACDPSKPILDLSQTTIKLSDPSWTDARIKLVQKRQATSPSF